MVLMHSRVLECKFYVGSFPINNFHIEMINDQPFEITLEINVLNKNNQDGLICNAKPLFDHEQKEN